MKGKRRQARKGGSRGTSSARPPERTRFATRLSGPVRSRWAPVVFFALLSLVYFAQFVFTDNVIYGIDTGPEFHKGKQPVLEKLKEIVK